MTLTTILLALFLAAPVLAEDIREGDTVFHPSWNDLQPLLSVELPELAVLN